MNRSEEKIKKLKEDMKNDLKKEVSSRDDVPANRDEKIAWLKKSLRINLQQRMKLRK